MAEGEDAWVVESSRDGERWRFFGKGWAKPGEPLILHGLPRFLRFRHIDSAKDSWSPVLERTGDEPMTLLRMREETRTEFWPTVEHEGMPVLLPGGEEGRLLRFEHSEDGERWTWAVEFRGNRSDYSG